MAAHSQFTPTIIRRKQLEVHTGLSRSTIYERINPRSDRYDPTFPKPVSIGAKAVGWVEGEVFGWLAAQIEKSRKA